MTYCTAVSQPSANARQDNITAGFQHVMSVTHLVSIHLTATVSFRVLITSMLLTELPAGHTFALTSFVTILLPLLSYLV